MTVKREETMRKKGERKEKEERALRVFKSYTFVKAVWSLVKAHKTELFAPNPGTNVLPSVKTHLSCNEESVIEWTVFRRRCCCVKISRQFFLRIKKKKKQSV